MSINPEFKSFQKHQREAEDLGRGIEVANFRELTENERAILRDRIVSVLGKVEDRMLGAADKLLKSDDADEKLSNKLAIRLAQLKDTRERVIEKKELLDEVEK